MPIKLVNDYGVLSWCDIQQLMNSGYSVIKTPHIGNQHPSNLVCGAMKVPLHMVTFTSGLRDKNFHPHLRIQGGKATELSCPTLWTPFAKTQCGLSLEDYHQNAVKERFAGLRVTTDIGMLKEYGKLTCELLRIATSSMSNLWYRYVDTVGVVHNVKKEALPGHSEILQDVFGITSGRGGWLVPNRAHILFDCIRQSLESGRDTIYHLSGPQMVGYIGKQIKSISKSYDAFRKELPSCGLPEVLTLYVVPVASSRFVTHMNRVSELENVMDVIRWYEGLANSEKRFAAERFNEVANAFPESFTSIEGASCMSQYDIDSADDLYLPDWLLTTPLNRVQKLHKQLSKHLVYTP